MPKEQVMNRNRDMKQTLQDQPQESGVKAIQPISLPGGVTPRTSGHDFLERELIQNVQRYGWHVVGVYGERFSPPFAYSVGLYKTLGQPEVVVVGLPVEDLRPLLSMMLGGS